MKLAFVLFKYFPYGGLQRDMLRIAAACQQLGYEIHVYTLSWQGDIPDGIPGTSAAGTGYQELYPLPELYQAVATTLADQPGGSRGRF